MPENSKSTIANGRQRKGTGHVRVDVVRPSDLEPEDLALWAEVLAGEPGLDSPFLSHQFVAAVAAVRPRVRVGVLSDSNGKLGFFPFERGARGQGIALAKGLTDVQGIIAPRALDLDLGGMLRACGLRLFVFDHLLATQERWLRGLPSRAVAERSPAVDLRGGFDAFVREKRASSKSLFQSTARKRRNLERGHGPVRLAFDEPHHGLLDQVLTWKSNQYRRTGRRDRFADPSTRALVHHLLDVRDDTFAAPLTVLYAGDTLVAAHLGLRSRGTLAWWFPVYDPAFAAFSPGLVMCLDLARTMVGHELTLLDLGKGDEPYKGRLSNTAVELLSGSVGSSRAAQAAYTARQWPREQVLRLVLGSPRLRKLSRSTLARVGQLRDRSASPREGMR
jgi:CelD/BcsL family acetyltransferase involved in cellulose biosynthesis